MELEIEFLENLSFHRFSDCSKPSSARMYKVAVVGHSQIPKHIDIRDPNVSVKIFRRSGARLEHINELPFHEIFDSQYDLLVLFLGGNDIATYPEEIERIIHDLKGLLLKYKAVAQEVVYVLIEGRQYPDNNRFGITNKVYESCRKRVNRNIRRFLMRQGIRSFNTTDYYFSNNVAKDGIHFNPAALNQLVQKIKDLIYLKTHPRS